MNHKSFGCLSMSGLLAAALVLFSVVGIGLARGGILFSAGPLSAKTGDGLLGGVRSHAEITRCSACHPAFWEKENLSDRCLACHTEVASQIEQGKGVHGIFLSKGMPACQSCHTEHHGVTASLTDASSMQKFPHDTVGFSLASHKEKVAGLPLACADCHPNRLSQFVPASCQICHGKIDAAFMQSHVSAYGSACLSCHDGLDTYGKGFDHQKLAFQLTGAHANVECSGCHAEARTVADLKAAPTNCSGCHAKDDPHNGRFGQDCARCHTPEDWKKATFDHSLADFKLTGKHAGVACEKCHQGGVFKGTPQDCYACHAKDDPHNGQFGKDCGQCHAPDDWKNATFDHSLAAFKLTGKHTGVPCESCHQGGVFKGTPQNCYSCHAKDDKHSGSFGTDCSICHTPDGWDQATFDHAKTAFPLTGAHQQLKCEQCHQQGAIMVFKGTPTECAGCHKEPAYHAGLFGTNCAACHTTAAWSPARFNGPHSFPRGHGGGDPNSCRTCHPNTLAGYTCYGCHAHTPGNIKSKHQEEGITNIGNCVRCHPTGQGGG
jgi:hypothetical protein